MNSDYTVRLSLPTDVEQALALYRSVFKTIDGKKDIEETSRRFAEKVLRGRALVADADGLIVGLAGYDRVKDVPPSLIDNASMETILRREIAYAQNHTEDQVLRAYLQQRQEMIGRGEIVLGRFDAKLVRNGITVQSHDLYCTEMAVIPELRRNGVSKALIQERERIARELRSSAMYVHCWENGYAAQSYLKCGFFPILKLGPEYEDGSACLLMGKRLML